MATWQFDFHLLPSAAVSDFYRGTPLTIPHADFDNHAWWKGVATPPNLRADLGKLLPSLRSWSPSLEQWGLEEGNRIDVMWDSGAIVNFFVRIDVRDVSHVFLVKLLELIRKNDWLMRTQDERMLRPSLTRLLSAIHKSDSFRFVEDPRAFVEALEKARHSEHDNGMT